MSTSPTSLYIGQKGYFDFYSPFDSSYHLNDMFLVIDHISAINTLVLDNINIESLYFTVYKLSKAQYTSFLNSNGVIVTFKATNGDRYSVPSTFIKSIPNPNDIPYRQLGINVVIGPLPLDYDITSLKNQLSKAILYTFGVEAVINFVPLSPVLLLPQTNTPNTPQYYDPNKVSLENLSLMISAIQSLSKYTPTSTPPTSTTPAYSVGVFGGGSNGGSLSTTSIYTYATNTTAAGANLTYGSQRLAATGNASIGVFGGGSGSPSTTSIYTYAGIIVVAGTDLSYSADFLAAAGNSAIGVFGGGYNASPLSTTSIYTYYTSILSTTSIYTYATNTTTAGTDLSYSSGGLAATGNSIVGVFGGGYYPAIGILSTTSIYSYSNSTAVAGTNLTSESDALTATGNSTVGVFGGGIAPAIGTISATSIYTYSTNTTAAGTDLTYGASSLAATGNSTIGVFGSGSSTKSNTSIYTFTTNISIVGANLTYSASGLAAVSSSNIGVTS